MKPTWRNGVLDYDIIMDFEALFMGDDPLRPTGYTYPLSIKASVMDDTPELTAYWDNEHTFVFDNNGKIQDDPDIQSISIRMVFFHLLSALRMVGLSIPI